MYFEDDTFTVEIKVVEKFTAQTIEKCGYDFIYNPEDYDFSDDYMKYYDISIKTAGKNLKIAFIGDYYIYEDNCAVFENGLLTFLIDDEIARIDAETGKLLFVKRFEIYGLGESIYKVNDRYIIKGELEIVCLDKDFGRLWFFGSRDIFECADNKEPFVLCDNRIKLYNFLDDYFELDFDGNLIEEIINENADLR